MEKIHIGNSDFIFLLVNPVKLKQTKQKNFCQRKIIEVFQIFWWLLLHKNCVRCKVK